MPRARQFQLHGLLGKGGFGVVYRATLQSDAFQTEVALKLLHSDEIPPSVIARFKDEARVLGLIRDSAVVKVYPPAELDGRPALVMEYVDGESTARLLKRFRAPLPPRVVTMVIAEVARSLHDVYEQAGPDDQPLQLVHRDLKPGNIQITPSGAVKVLDFGLAKASYDGREAQTTQHLFGTPHYMAPERLHGQDGPASDIFSLGVTWRRLMWGDVPIGGGRFKPNKASPPARTRMLEEAEILIERMLAVEPDVRPTAREVEELGLDLSERMGGPTLRTWARENVQPWRGEDADLSGAVFDESVVTTLAEPPAPVEVSATTLVDAPPRRRPGWVLPVGVAGVVMVGTAALLLGVVWMFWDSLETTSELASVQQAEPVPTPGPPPAPTPSPQTVEPADATVSAPVPGIDEPATEPATEPKPDPLAPETSPAEPNSVEPVARPAPSTRAPSPAPTPAPTPTPPSSAEPAEPPPAEPAPAEPPPAEPAPEPQAPVARPPQVVVQDDGAVVFFRGADGTRYSANELEPGTYTLEANFDPTDPSALLELGQHTFMPDSTYFVRCVRTVNNCRVRQ